MNELINDLENGVTLLKELGIYEQEKVKVTYQM